MDPWSQFPDARQKNNGPAVAQSAAGADAWGQFPDAGGGAQPSASATTAATAPPARTPAPPLDDSFGDKAIRTSAGVLGAPVDAVNSVLDLIGIPTSDAPFMGSQSIEGMMTAASGSREAREIEAAAPGVTQEGGAPLGERMYESFLNTPKATELFLTNTYGPEGQGWYKLADRFGNPTDRYVTRSDDGSETLFNSPGIDLGDIVGMIGGAPDLAGAVAGGAASVPAYAGGPATGIPASAALSSLGAQMVGESVGRLFPENREAEPSITDNVLPRAGGEALNDTILGLITGGAAKVGTAVANKARAPFAKSASDPMATDFRAAADRLESQGYDINPLPSESGAGGFVPRAEGFLEKLPGSAEKMRQYREGGDQAIARFQDDLAGGVDPTEVGRDVVSELSTQRKNLMIDREQALQRSDELIDLLEQGVTTRQGPQMSAEAAGQQTRAGLERARGEFQNEARRLYDAARNAPGGRDAIVDMAPVREQVDRIRAALPPSAAGGPSAEFAPQGLTRLLGGVDDIADTMTLDQARQMRTLVSDAIDDRNLLPGVPERYLNELRQSLTRAIDGSVDRVQDPALRDALYAANTYYRENVDRFSRKGVAEAYRPDTSAGFVEDNNLVARLLSGRGKPGVIRETRDLMGADSPEWAATRRNAIEQILDTGRDQTRSGRRVVNVDGLVAKLNAIDDEAVQELFGVPDAQQLRNLAADISNRSKYLDADALSQNGSPNILLQLQAAARADEQIARDFRNNVVAPFLRGEDGSAARMQPAELVPWLYRRASADEATAVMSRLPAPMRAEVERGVVADIIESAISKNRGDLGAVRRLVVEEANPADSTGIAELLGAGKDSASRQQSARISALLSPKSRQALRDLALITAKRQERDATTAAIGGLAAGAAVTNILSKPSSALHGAIIARGLAQLITTPAFRRWVTNTKQFRPSVAGQAQTIAVAPALADIASGALGENQDVQTALQWLNEGLSQVDEAGRRISRPPQGAKSWEDYFGGDELMQAIGAGR